MCSAKSHPTDGSYAALVSRVAQLGPHTVVLLDGPSGSGKSTLADRLIRDWPGGGRAPVLVRLDDIYPGWRGLDAAGEHVAEHLLEPRRDSGKARWRRHDWINDKPAEWNEIDSGRPLLIEGCGVATRRNRELANLTVWISADDVVRKKRALARDGGAFDPWWDIWQEQFDKFAARERPRTGADVQLESASVEE